MLELAGEPLFVLAQTQLRFKLRVATDASANLAKAVVLLALLRLQLTSEVTALCLAQVPLSLVCMQVSGGRSMRRSSCILER